MLWPLLRRQPLCTASLSSDHLWCRYALRLHRSAAKYCVEPSFIPLSSTSSRLAQSQSIYSLTAEALPVRSEYTTVKQSSVKLNNGLHFPLMGLGDPLAFIT